MESSQTIRKLYVFLFLAGKFVSLLDWQKVKKVRENVGDLGSVIPCAGLNSRIVIVFNGQASLLFHDSSLQILARFSERFAGHLETFVLPRGIPRERTPLRSN